MEDKDFEKYRDAFYGDIPDNVLLDWLSEIGWSTCDGGSTTTIVKFHSISDPEDSYFSVLGGKEQNKDGIREAIKKAFFALKDKEKEERRAEYESLKKEFDS